MAGFGTPGGGASAVAGDAGVAGAADEPDGGSPVFSREALLASVADCAVARAREFEERALALVEATATYDAEPSDEHLGDVHAAWALAMERWQELEVWQFGPLAQMPALGAESLRLQVYAWPAFNRCAIDQQIVSRRYLESDFDRALTNTRGLGAIEYLSFYPGGDNGCLPTQAINAGGTWSALGDAEIGLRKAGYAHAVAADVAARAATLVERWAPELGNFHRVFAGAGRGSAVYPSMQSALNALSDAMFYVDTQLKDMKLAWVMGIAECGGPCPVPAESPFAGFSKRNVRGNLLGFRALFQGCGPSGSGLGFDDLLIDLGQVELAERMKAELAAAIAALDALEQPSIEAAMAVDPGSVFALYDAVKRLTDSLKSDFITVLDLEPPPGAGDDTD
jgi:predicted lipoprotein